MRKSVEQGAETSFSVSSSISPSSQDIQGTLLMVSKVSQEFTKIVRIEQSKFSDYLIAGIMGAQTCFCCIFLSRKD